MRTIKVTLFALLAAAVITTAFGAGFLAGPAAGAGASAPLLISDASGRSSRAASDGVPEQFRAMKWVWERDLRGLHRRREAEAKLFETGLAAVSATKAKVVP